MHICRRSPRGERGLKFIAQPPVFLFKPSLPSRGAWIEIPVVCAVIPADVRRSPRGERGLKLEHQIQVQAEEAVAPLAGSVD